MRVIWLSTIPDKTKSFSRRLGYYRIRRRLFDMSVRKWSACSHTGRESLVDDTRPGQSNTVIMADLISKVYDLLRSDRRRVTMQMLVMKVDVSVRTVRTITVTIRQ